MVACFLATQPHPRYGEAAAITRNYTLFRYMLGCNAYGKWPTKFNGGLFTFDPAYVDKRYPFTPDFRRWGGGTFTAQNQRLVYWGMVKSGDYDMLRTQLDFYKRILPTAMLRVRTYWGHGGANFTEQIENFGLSNIDEYGKNDRRTTTEGSTTMRGSNIPGILSWSFAGWLWTQTETEI